MPKTTGPAMSAEMRACAGDCLQCRDLCLKTIDYCRDRGAGFVDSRLIDLLSACAKACGGLAADVLELGHVAPERCRSVADLSAECGRRCSEYTDDETMRACAEACLRCAGSCKVVYTGSSVPYDNTVADTFPASDPPSTRAGR